MNIVEINGVNVGGFYVTTDIIGGVLLFVASKGEAKSWAEWYDATRNRVECIDTSRPDSFENITEAEDIVLETGINEILRDIALDINAPAMVLDSEGLYLGYHAETRAEKKPMIDAIVARFNGREK